MVCVINNVLVHHTKIDVDVELPIGLGNADRWRGLGAIALLNEISIIDLEDLLADEDNNGGQEAWEIPHLGLPSELIDPVIWAYAARSKLVDGEETVRERRSHK